MTRPRVLLFLVALLTLGWGPASANDGLRCHAAIERAERGAGIPAGLLQAIGRVESGRRDPTTGRHGAWPWTINAEGRGHFLPSREAAIAAVRDMQARGVRVIDVGCMQVNLHHHPRAFASLDEAFDPEANTRYAARFLTELFAARPDWMVAAGHYHSHTPDLAQAYRARVQSAWAETRPTALAAAPPPRPAGIGPTLSNGAERAQLLTMSGAAGRGLDAYRANPVPVTGRAITAWLPRR